MARGPTYEVNLDDLLDAGVLVRPPEPEPPRGWTSVQIERHRVFEITEATWRVRAARSRGKLPSSRRDAWW